MGTLWIVGCSGGAGENPNWPERFPTTGTVTFQGKPIADAEVTFTSESGNAAAAAKTDSAGHFNLTTFVEKDGAVAGKHAVAIRRVDVVDQTPEGVDVSAGGESMPPKITWIIPEKYSNTTTSGLTADVSASGPNVFTFDLR